MQTDFGCKGPKSRGKQPRSCAKVSKQSFSGKGSTHAKTARRWAWKQPSFEESVIAHWSSVCAPKMYRGSSDSPKRRLSYLCTKYLVHYKWEGSRTFCFVIKENRKINLEQSEVRMLTWVTKNHVKFMIAESLRFSTPWKSMWSESVPKKIYESWIRWGLDEISRLRMCDQINLLIWKEIGFLF